MSTHKVCFQQRALIVTQLISSGYSNNKTVPMSVGEYWIRYNFSYHLIALHNQTDNGVHISC